MVSAFLRARVGVEQQHAVRLQAFGAMHREQAHGLGVGTAGGGHAALLHGADFLLADHPLGGRQLRHVQGDDVGHAQQAAKRASASRWS